MREKSKAARGLEILRTQSLATLVLQELERMILEGELKAGERINEKVMADRQNVSRGPVREAIRRLEETGLVEVVVNRGAFVRKLQLAEALELYDIRSAILGLAGKLLAERITDGQVKALFDRVERMEAAAGERDLERYYPLNLEFHATLMEYTGNRRLGEFDASMAKELYLFRRRSLVTGSGLSASSGEHREIVEALAEGDSARVSKVMSDHALAGKRRVLGMLAETVGQDHEHT